MKTIKEYQKPTMEVLIIQQQQIICGSKGVKSLDLPNSDDFVLDDDGLEEPDV